MGDFVFMKNAIFICFLTKIIQRFLAWYCEFIKSMEKQIAGWELGWICTMLQTLSKINEADFTKFRSTPKLNRLYLLNGSLTFLAYFQKMKVGFSNHQLVCLSMCSPIITFELLGRFSWNLLQKWYHSRGPWWDNFNRTVSIILRLLRFKFVR
jgi:hypothetical protein